MAGLLWLQRFAGLVQSLEFLRVLGIHDVGMAADLFLHIGVHDAWPDSYARNIGLFDCQCQTKVIHGGFGGAVGSPP